MSSQLALRHTIAAWLAPTRLSDGELPVLGWSRTFHTYVRPQSASRCFVRLLYFDATKDNHRRNLSIGTDGLAYGPRSPL
jgi:hypothetical protein